jgi:hypothetical protein
VQEPPSNMMSQRRLRQRQCDAPQSQPDASLH